jgi:hypothetical protein
VQAAGRVASPSREDAPTRSRSDVPSDAPGAGPARSPSLALCTDLPASTGLPLLDSVSTSPTTDTAGSNSSAPQTGTGSATPETDTLNTVSSVAACWPLCQVCGKPILTGLGSGIKPCIEPAVLCRKPLSESTIARNVLRWGTGAINVDGCRYAYGDGAWPGPQEGPPPSVPERANLRYCAGDGLGRSGEMSTVHDLGRFPANVYATPKCSRSERERGCEGLPTKAGHEAVDRAEGSAGLNNPRAGAGRTAGCVANTHPT